MIKVITDEKLVDEVLERGVEMVYPEKDELKKKLLSGERIRLYCGFDPSAPSLHIGNAILINKLSQFQALGHEVIFLIGDFTGMIGDPTDKEATRAKLTREEVLENCKSYKAQAAGYLNFEGENPAAVKYNSEWNDKVTFKDLIEISSNFTLQYMINRQMFKRNLTVVRCRLCNFEWKSPIQFSGVGSFQSSSLKGNKTTCPNCGEMTGLDKEDIVMKETEQLRDTPIGFHELLYPLAQAYDSVAMNVDLEIGGNDQMFNMMCGRDLMKAMGKKDKAVMTLKLLADDQGKKMGKSEDNAVFLDQSPEDMYGKVMSWTDGVLAVAFELCTKVPMEEVKKIEEDLKNPDNNPRDYKMKLAFEIVRINYSENAAKKAQDYFVKTIQKKEVPNEIAEAKVFSGTNILDVMVEEKIAESRGDAKRKIKGGGVSIDGEKVNDIGLEISKDMTGKVLKVGKREFREISVK